MGLPAPLCCAFLVTCMCAGFAACTDATNSPAAPQGAGGSRTDPFDASSSPDAPRDVSIYANDTSDDHATTSGTDGAADLASNDSPPDSVTRDADASVTDAAPNPGPNATFNPFNDVYVYGNHDGGSQRSFDVTVDFPAMPLTYRSITLKIALRCPTAAARSCDYVDQRGFVGVVRKVGDTETVDEIQRFITPYGSPASFVSDVTSIRPLLSGPVVVRLWVDTWAYPGANMGEGWRVDVSFDFVGGTPAHLPIAVIPLWGESIFDFGDPAKPQPYIPAQEVAIPADAKAVEIRSFITGHGQGNSENCGEFCPKVHSFTIGGRPVTKSIWRTDCTTTASQGQTSGAYVYSRAGWCPGATVLPWVQDVTMMAPAWQLSKIAYAVQDYTNTCQPAVCTLTSCAFYGTPYFNGSCVYDQQFHAVPYYVLSSMLVVYGN